MSHVPRRSTFCGYDGNRTQTKGKNIVIWFMRIAVMETPSFVSCLCVCGRKRGVTWHGLRVHWHRMRKWKICNAFVYFNYAVQIDGFDGVMPNWTASLPPYNTHTHPPQTIRFATHIDHPLMLRGMLYINEFPLCHGINREHDDLMCRSIFFGLKCFLIKSKLGSDSCTVWIESLS